MSVPVFCVDEIDAIIQNPSKYFVNSPAVSSESAPKSPQAGFHSPTVARPESAWSPSPLPIDLSALVPQISLKFSTDSLPKPPQTAGGAPDQQTPSTPAPAVTDSEEDFWSFPIPTQPQPPAIPDVPPAAAAPAGWRSRPESTMLPIDLNELVPSFSPAPKPKPPKDSWKTRSTFNLVKAQTNASDLALLDVQNRILALLNVENRSLVVVERVEHDGNDDDDDDDDGAMRRRRFKFVEPDTTYCDVAKLPIRPPPRKPRHSLPKESLLEPPESQPLPGGRRKFQRRPIGAVSHRDPDSPALSSSIYETDSSQFDDHDFSAIESW
jgi:hypothetical protein